MIILTNYELVPRPPPKKILIAKLAKFSERSHDQSSTLLAKISQDHITLTNSVNEALDLIKAMYLSQQSNIFTPGSLNMKSVGEEEDEELSVLSKSPGKTAVLPPILGGGEGPSVDGEESEEEEEEGKIQVHTPAKKQGRISVQTPEPPATAPSRMHEGSLGLLNPPPAPEDFQKSNSLPMLSEEVVMEEEEKERKKEGRRESATPKNTFQSWWGKSPTRK